MKNKGIIDREAVYHSIRETAKITGLSEYSLRQKHKQGRLPGVYSGNRFLVNIPSLQKRIADVEKGVGVNEF